jgi:cytochrome c biogenesis protein CcmG/thiol:disulfide interchange protein DsbE
VPETFVVGRDARIAYKLVGPITESNYETQVLPAIEAALRAK